MITTIRPLRLIATVCLVLISNVASAEDSSSKKTLLGDWGGVRSALEDVGITSDAIITADLMGNVSGGIHKTAGVLSKYNLSFSVDTGKAVGLEGGTFFVYLLGSANRHITPYVGEAQVVDNIDAYNTAKLYELFYNHSFYDDRFSFLVGLHDYNAEFDVLDYAAPLINSSFGIQVDISQVVPSIFATTSLAALTRVKFGEQGYLKAAAYDGIPGDPNDPRGTHIKLKSKDGIFYGLEAGLVSGEGEPHYKWALGGWHKTTDFEDFGGTMRKDNQGVYSIGEALLISEQDGEQGLGAFYQLGFARSDRNRFGNYFSVGLNYVGLIPGREEDTSVLAFARAQNTADYRKAVEESTRTESILEFTYRAKITDYFSLQPDFQYIVNPNTDKTIGHATVVGVRAETAL